MAIVIPPERLALLRRIQESQFVAIDLNLYLDTHPDDEKALADYNGTTQQLRGLVTEYERLYGPLAAAGRGMSRAPWAWIEDPWPWDICY